MNSDDVRRLRKAGRLQEALDAARQIMTDNPGDFKNKSEYEWVIFDCIKIIVANMVAEMAESRPINRRDVDKLMGWMNEYHSLEPSIPGMACSNILGQLAKVGSNLPKFPGIIHWVGIEGLRAEDWQPRQYQGKTYSSLAMNIARTLCKWVKAHPGASHKQMALALDWAERVRKSTKDDDSLWLYWDMAILLRQMGDFRRAAELLTSVIKAKRNEFWVWAEAARLYAEEQPDLALACACRALQCGSDSKFTVNVHRELAQMLADRGEFAQASSELALAITLRQEQGWGIDAELQDLINSSWYDPSAQGAEKASDFYAHHSQDALVLCFDSVEVKPATYLGTIVPQQQKDAQPGRKVRPLPRFAIRESNGASVSIVGPGVRCRDIKIGDPVALVLGRQRDSDRDAIVQVSVRSDGASWDCTDSGIGLVTREAADERRVKIFVDRDLEVGIDDGAWIGSHSPKIGEGVRFRVTQNRKTGRRDLFAVEPGPRPDVDVKVATGYLKRNLKGFAFVDDAFVPPFMVETVLPEVDTVVAVLVYAKHPKENRYGWRAVAISAA